MSGEAGDVQTAGFLIALRAKGETAEELAGPRADRPRPRRAGDAAQRALHRHLRHRRRAAHDLQHLDHGDVRRGGRRRRRRQARQPLGDLQVRQRRRAGGARRADRPDPDDVARCLEETGLGFMFAPTHHPAFRHIVPVRRALGVRTIFNLLGPLTNPAGAPRQLLGVVDPAYLERMGQALAILGTERALLVHGRDGLDEVSTGAISDVVEVADGGVRDLDHRSGRARLLPARRGRDRRRRPGAQRRDAARGARRARPGPARDVVVLNAAAAIWVAGAAPTLAGRRCRWPRPASTRARPPSGLDAFVATTRRLAPVRVGCRRAMPTFLETVVERTQAELAARKRDGARRRAGEPPRARPPRPPLLGGADRRGDLPDRRDEARQPLARADPARGQRLARWCRPTSGPAPAPCRC